MRHEGQEVVEAEDSERRPKRIVEEEEKIGKKIRRNFTKYRSERAMCTISPTFLIYLLTTSINHGDEILNQE